MISNHNLFNPYSFTNKMDRKILLTPGPATTSDSVKMAQVIPDICPREKEFGEILDYITRNLTKVAGGDDEYACILIGGSGTSGLDATINSVVNGKILIINNGAYGKRVKEIAESYSLDYKELFFNWDEKISLEKIEEELKRDPEIKYISIVHHETTTGILNPIEKVGELAEKYNCVFIVDAISSFAGIPIDVKKANISFMISTSNKCIQGMPGVCFIICKKKELERTKDYKRKSYYLNLYLEYEFFKNNKQTRFTPPVQTIYALKKAIEEFLEEGAERRHSRYKENCSILLKGMEELGFKKSLKNIEESNLLTTFFEPENKEYSFDKMHDSLCKKGFTIYPGKIKEKTFRLANLGAINSEDIERFLTAIKETLKEMNLNLK